MFECHHQLRYLLNSDYGFAKKRSENMSQRAKRNALDSGTFTGSDKSNCNSTLCQRLIILLLKSCFVFLYNFPEYLTFKVKHEVNA
jgi:hypothetical protein